jgi:hypothetical protein
MSPKHIGSLRAKLATRRAGPAVASMDGFGTLRVAVPPALLLLAMDLVDDVISLDQMVAVLANNQRSDLADKENQVRSFETV